MENLDDSNVEHWTRMAEQAIVKYHDSNKRRDDWISHHEIHTLHKFQRKLAKGKVNVRLFATAQRHIQFAHSGRIRHEQTHPRFAPDVEDAEVVI